MDRPLIWLLAGLEWRSRQVLCLAPIELVTEAERRLYRVLSGLAPGTAVIGGLVVFIPVVDGAMQRRQADAVAFLPETVVVVRAVAMGRQSGELRPSASGMWTVGGEVLRLSGGGSSPAGQLRKAAELIHATLNSGGLDPGSVPALAAIDGAITSVRDRCAAGPVVCSMDAGDVLTGLRHSANLGSQGDSRVWTTADVRAALTIFGLQARGPSVEELNNEGFQYSPYVLRRSESAVLTRADLAPAVSLLSGPYAQAPSARPPRPAEPAYRQPRVPPPTADTPERAEPEWDPDPVWQREPASQAEARSDDSGVGGLFADPVQRHTGSRPAQRHTGSGPARRSRPHRRRSSRPAALFGIAALVVAAAVAGLLYALTSGLRGDEPAGPDGEAVGTSPTGAPRETTSANPTVDVTQDVDGTTYTLEAARSDTDCALNAYGQVAQFFVATPCRGMTRALFTTAVDDAPAVVSVSVVTMPDEASAADLRDLVNTSGTGNVSDLLRAGVRINGGPGELVAAAYASELSGTEVRIVEVAWTDADTEGDEALLEAVPGEALLLDVSAG